MLFVSIFGFDADISCKLQRDVLMSETKPDFTSVFYSSDGGVAFLKLVRLTNYF